MLDDLESNIIKEEKAESTSNKFPLNRFNLPLSQQNVNVLSMSTSKKYIYLVTERSELLRFESETLKPIQQAFNIDPPQSPPNFYENLTKIWTDREGNHSIIRYNGGIYYFNSNGSFVKELKSLNGIEVCAVGFDDANKDANSTGNFLVTDYLNNIYECNILIDKFENNGDFKLKDNADKLVTLSFKESENEDDDDYYINDPRKKNYDRIYGIKFFRTIKTNIEKNENECYIIAVTKNRLYQFLGPGLTSFRQILGRFVRNPLLFNDCCKYFPQGIRRKGDFTGTDLDILYKTVQRNIDGKKSIIIDIFNQFGWKTESGYCFSQFEYNTEKNTGGLPNELKNFTVIPFARIIKGERETGIEPKHIVQTNNHIFLLFQDCITVISKLTSNIIHTQYCQTEFNQMLYHEFGKDNGIIILTSKNGLYQISLKDENNEIWKDYLEIGNYETAQQLCDSNKLKLKINKIDAEYEFDENNSGEKAAEKFANSDEKFEIVCLKYLMRNDLKGLKKYLEKYMAINLHREEKKKKQEKKKEEDNDDENNENKEKKKEDTLQLNLICTWILEIFINQIKEKKDSKIDDFRELVRNNLPYLEPSLIYQLLQSYGRIDEFIEFASLMGDFEKVILYFINQGEIGMAIEKLTWFASFSDDKETIKTLTNIFLENCHIFFKNNPKESISLLQQRLKDVSMERIVQAIMSTTDKDNDKDNNENSDNKIIDKKKVENSQAILSYLKSLIEKPKVGEEEESNIHNLYIYYLSRNKANQEAILDYLKGPLKNDDNDFNYYHKKKEALFQLDYAKKLFKNNPPAYSLVLALMQKYAEGVRTALMQKTDECTQIAKFIASNAPGEKLRKKLWIDIFSVDNQNEFKQALDIMKESKILKIEDVLPHITDTIKIEEFKKQISNCINEYEANIKKLKEDINDYNKTAENIKGDIYRVKKKSIEIQYSNCKCEICQAYIKDKNMFLFPCGHKFDMNCIRDCLLNYEATGLDYIHNKNVEIDKLFYQLGISKKRAFEEKNRENENDNKKKEDNSERGRLINKINFLSTFKKQDIQEEKDPKQINILKEKLYDILSEQCVLCGDFLVDSIQCSLSQKDKYEPDNNGLYLKKFDEPDFVF